MLDVTGSKLPGSSLTNFFCSKMIGGEHRKEKTGSRYDMKV